MASQSDADSIEEVLCMGESNQCTHGSPDGYTNKGTGKTSDLALNSSEGPNAQLQPGDTQSYFPNFCPTDAAGLFYQGSEVAYDSNPMIQPQTVEPPPVPSPTHEQGTFGSVSVNPKQYNAILRRRQFRKTSPPSQENFIAIQMRDISKARQSLANKRPRGENGRFISMNKPQQSGSSAGGGAYNNAPQVGSSEQPRSPSYGHISTANMTDQRLIILVPENSDESGATTNIETQYWQEKSNTQNSASSTECTALVDSDLAVFPPPIAEFPLDFSFSPNTSDNLFNLDEFDMTGMFDEPAADGVGSAATAPVGGEMVLPTMLRDRLCALKEHLTQNPAETFIKDVSIVQDIMSGIADTELPTDTYLAICEILSLTDIAPAYDAAKERQKKRVNLIGLTQRLSDSKSIVESSFWRLQEEQNLLVAHKVSEANLQQRIAAQEEEINRGKAHLVNVSSLIIKQMRRLKNLQEEGQKAKENADALEAELNDQIAVLGGAQADEELVGRPARVVEAAKQKIDSLLGENP